MLSKSLIILLIIIVILILLVLFLNISKSYSGPQRMSKNGQSSGICQNFGPKSVKDENITQSNLQMITDKNKDISQDTLTPVYAPNNFIDIPPDQFLKQYTGTVYPKQAPTFTEGNFKYLVTDGVSLKREFSWHNSNNPYKINVMPPVQDQAQCGSCWAFSATSVLCAQIKIRELLCSATGTSNSEECKAILDTKKSIVSPDSNIVLVPSVQQVLDCVVDCKNCNGICDGCGGGFPAYVFSWYEKEKGSELELYDPYTGKKSTLPINACGLKTITFDIEKGIGFCKIEDKLEFCTVYKQGMSELCQYRTIGLFNTDDKIIPKICQALEKYGPFTVCIDAKNLQFYKTGYATLPNGEINHAVVLCGYGVDGTRPYWIMKNSWGTEWGEKGYFKADALSSYLAGLVTIQLKK
jgi:cathepsin F